MQSCRELLFQNCTAVWKQTTFLIFSAVNAPFMWFWIQIGKSQKSLCRLVWGCNWQEWEVFKQCFTFAIVRSLSCWEEGDYFTQKGVEALSALVSLHLLCISWAGPSSAATGSWLSVRAEDVSPVSYRPIWFPLTNVTAVAPGYRADNSSVCVCECVCESFYLHVVLNRRKETVCCSCVFLYTYFLGVYIPHHQQYIFADTFDTSLFMCHLTSL